MAEVVKTTTNNPVPKIYEQERSATIGMIQGSVSFGIAGFQTRKKQSDMNLLDAQREWVDVEEVQNFNSIFDREKRLLVLCTNADISRPSRIVIIDVDYLSKTYMTEMSWLDLPHTGDDLAMCAWQKTATQPTDVNTVVRNSLVVPCPNTSRIYIVSIDENQNMRIATCIEPDELSRWNLSHPLAACNIPGRANRTVVTTLADRTGHAKGAFLHLDRRFFAPLTQRRVNAVIDSEGDVDSSLQPIKIAKSVPLGGSVALLYKQGYLFSTEWAEPKHLFNSLSMNKLYNDDNFGHALDVWDVRAQHLLQRILLPQLDGRMTVCVRCLHHPELTHAYVCTAIGGCIFHLHKNTRTGLFSLDRVARFAPVVVNGWHDQHVLAFPVDMVISMDDQFLYVSCWLQGFIAQFEISDPFQPTIMNRIFIGGVIHKSNGIRLDTIFSKNFSPQKRMVGGANFEGGPARLQLSLDGRRLYVSNSFLRVWDHQFYPNLSRKGSSIALIQIDANKTMEMDERGGVYFGNASVSKPAALAKHIASLSNNNQNKKSGSSSSAPNNTSADGQKRDVFLAREMRFLNGDSTSDAF